MKCSLPLLFILISLGLRAQPPHYTDSLQAFRDLYINTHGVIKDNDRSRLQFYRIDHNYCIPVKTERIYEAPWFAMETSGKVKKNYRVYAILHFIMNGKAFQLSVYQSQQLLNTEEFKDYLFIPFTDLTNGEETYENGRYIDLLTSDLEKDSFFLDFNKCYNPYCAYISHVYNCPVPPRENDLSLFIKAGEKKIIQGK